MRSGVSVVMPDPHLLHLLTAWPILLVFAPPGRLGTNTWPVVKELVDGVITVGEEAIVGAMRLIYLHAKVVVEASGAVGLAAALKASKEEADGCGLRGCKAVGIVLCGGNVDLDAKGLWDMTNWQPGV